MPKPNDLLQMIEHLKRAPSALERVRLVARLWRQMSDLPRPERMLVARHLGIEGAEELLDSLTAGRGRISPSLAAHLLRILKSTDPTEVQDFVRALSSPAPAAEHLIKGLDLVRKAAQQSYPAGPPRQPSSRPAPVTSLPLTPVPSAFPSPSAPVISRPAAPVSATVEMPETTGAPAARPASRPRAARDARLEPSAVIEAPRPVDPTPEDVLLRKLRETPALPARLKLVREAAGSLGRLDVRGIAELLEALPGGWSRRRALMWLLRAGSVADLETLLAALFRLDSAGYLWNVIPGARTLNLESAGIERLIAAAPTPAAARIAARRLRPHCCLS